MSAEALRVFREGFCPQLTDAELEALARGLRDNDPALIQGKTRLPEAGWLELPCEAACAMAYGPWKANSFPLQTTGEVEEYFERLTVTCDDKLGSGHACRLFVWWDETPRTEARLQLLAEVERELQRRQG